MKNKVMLVIPILIGICIMFVLPFISASAEGWFNMTLTADANVTTGSNNVTTTVAVAAIYNVTNVTCYYNVSGGASYPASNLSHLGYAINDSKGDTSFTITGTISTESTRRTNVTCVLSNQSASSGTLALAGGNDTISVMNVTIDGTVPTLTLGLDVANIGTRGRVLASWTATDSSSKLRNVSIMVISPDSQKCPTYGLINGTLDSRALTSIAQTSGDIQEERTMCAGDYTVNLTASDFSGNLNSQIITFRASIQGKKGSSNTLGGTSGGPGENLGNYAPSENLPLGEQGTNIAIILIIGIAAYLFFKRKK